MILKKRLTQTLSHLLINLGEKAKKQNKIKEKIYQSYFVEGLDIGNKAILINIGKQFNINENIINKFFNSENLEKINSYKLIAKQKKYKGSAFL